MSTPLTSLPAALADAMDATRLRLLSAGLLGRRGITLALAGSGRGAGVSTVAIGMASALVRAGPSRVLLIDGTPLGRRASALLGCSAPALSARAFDGPAADMAAAVQPLEGLGFDLLTLTDAPGSEQRPAAEPAWSALCHDYDNVIVDAGALNTDTPFRWSAWVDHTALVLDTTRVTREMMDHQRRALEGGRLRLSGFILNKRSFHVPAAVYRALG